MARGGLPGGRPVWQLVLEVLSLNIRVLESGELWLENLRLLPRRELLTLPILYINLELANSIKHTHFVFKEGEVLCRFIVIDEPIKPELLFSEDNNAWPILVGIWLRITILVQFAPILFVSPD